MIMNIPKEDYEAIEKEIYSDESVVGIDAKKTHIMIIHMLQQIESKLNELEERLDAQK
jgi:hypothetical protein